MTPTPSSTLPSSALNPATGEPNPAFEFRYTNHVGKVGDREAIPMGLVYGTNEFHPEPTYLMVGWDLERQAERTYDMRKVVPLTPELRRGLCEISGGISPVYMVCHAYEAGVGKGRSGIEIANPYDDSPGLNAQCHEAWQYGYAEGREWFLAQGDAYRSQAQELEVCRSLLKDIWAVAAPGQDMPMDGHEILVRVRRMRQGELPLAAAPARVDATADAEALAASCRRNEEAP